MNATKEGAQNIKPFLKWAGGKRWLVERPEFDLPAYSGRYFEPFLGGGAVFFAHNPRSAILSDLNPKLIQAYEAIRNDWQSVWNALQTHQEKHSREHYYLERKFEHECSALKAAQFIYLNRACWNGLYRENLRGTFNVPIGTKTKVIFDNDNFETVSRRLQCANLICSDFEGIIDRSKSNDFIFVDPPYTTAHNLNGFVKYNQKIFSWDDQIRLRDSLVKAKSRGATVCITNADHPSIKALYSDSSAYITVPRYSVISGTATSRKATTEAMIYL